MKLRAISTQDTYAIRLPVLRLGGTLDDVRTSQDDQSDHLGLFAPDLVGVASLVPDNLDDPNGARLRKLAVLSAHQGKGYGTALITGIENLARQNRAQYLWFDARLSALRFYTSLGFAQCSDTFQKNGRAYVKMRKHLIV